MSYTFSIYEREMVYSRAGYRCECQCEKCLGNDNLQVHHRIPNTKMNRGLYGEKLQSENNAVVLCGWCHINCKSNFKGWRKEGEDG
jgi:5-methylcytosine-specific restriction endonuclease McrA